MTEEIPIGTAVPIRIDGGAEELERFLGFHIFFNLAKNSDKHNVSVRLILNSMFEKIIVRHPERQILFEKGTAPVLGLVSEN